MMPEQLKCPWIAFGGKRRAAPLVWERLGDVSNFGEPFANSAAMLLCRPHPPKIETLNDVDGDVTNALRAIDPMIGRPDEVADHISECINDLDPFIANAWRSLKEAPDEVAAWADQQVNELNLHAMHRWLVLGEESRAFIARMRSDPEYFDPRRAGYFITGNCMWIGSGWCSTGVEWEQRPFLAGNPEQYGQGIHAKGPPAKRPLLAGAANEHGERTHQGQAEQIPFLGGFEGQRGRGVHAKGPSDHHRPQLADAYGPGRGVHATGPGLHEKRPALSGGGADGTVCSRLGYGVHSRGPSDPSLIEGTCAARRAWLCEWFGRLRDRLRTVRVCCGDWRRMCDSESVTTRLGLTGIFFDPPYPRHRADGSVSRSKDLYATDAGGKSPEQIRDELLAYGLERGDDPMLRLCIAGYEGDGYEALESRGWSVIAWRASGGYGNRNKDNENAVRERLWFNKSCLDPEKDRLSLFDRIGALI